MTDPNISPLGEVYAHSAPLTRETLDRLAAINDVHFARAETQVFAERLLEQLESPERVVEETTVEETTQLEGVLSMPPMFIEVYNLETHVDELVSLDQVARFIHNTSGRTNIRLKTGELICTTTPWETTRKLATGE